MEPTKPRLHDTHKKDKAPRGVFRDSRDAWKIRFTCGAGHIHEQKVGRLKEQAVDTYHERRKKTHDDPGWCPRVERRRKREEERAKQEVEMRRMTFKEYADDFIEWAKINHRSWQKDDSRLSRVLPVFGRKKLDEITTADVEHFLASIREGERAVAPATVNRYRDLLSGMFKRAIRNNLLDSNPVKGIPKLKEPDGRLVYLPAHGAEEVALLDALDRTQRGGFIGSLHLGLRWSEQADLTWRDVDLLTNLITITRSKNGRTRVVPMNSVVRRLLLDLAAARKDPDDAGERVFTLPPYRTMARMFNNAVARAQASLRAAGKDASRLDGYTWHANRHTWASRLIMAGVDARSVQELGGWRTLAMVQRYAQLAPDHLLAAMERLVAGPAKGASLGRPAAELGFNLDSTTPGANATSLLYRN